MFWQRFHTFKWFWNTLIVFQEFLVNIFKKFLFHKNIFFFLFSSDMVNLISVYLSASRIMTTIRYETMSLVWWKFEWSSRDCNLIYLGVKLFSYTFLYYDLSRIWIIFNFNSIYENLFNCLFGNLNYDNFNRSMSNHHNLYLLSFSIIFITIKPHFLI